MRSNSKHSADGFSVPLSHWSRFAVDGTFAGCSERLHVLWSECGLLGDGCQASDFFVVGREAGEAFFTAWLAAVKGSNGEAVLQVAGWDRIRRRCRFLPEFDGSGEVSAVVIAVAESSVPQEESELLAAAFVSLATPLCIVDENGRIALANPSFCALLATREENLLEKNVLEAVDPQASAADRELLAENLAKRGAFQQVVRRHAGGGETRAFRLDSCFIEGAALPRFVIRCSPLEAHAHDLKASIETIEAIRARFRKGSGTHPRVEEALDAAREEIETMRLESEAKSDFLANMSHEIRTPMNAVVGFCDLLMSTRLDDEQSEYVEAIFQSGQLLIQLIGQVLDYSKIEAGHLELVEEKVSLRQIMLEVQAIMGTRLRSKDLEFRLDCDELGDPAVLGDATRIKQILVNLLGNAYKFTRRGFIELKASAQPSSKKDHLRLRFRVTDTGVGIDPGRMSSLFNPFAQANSRVAKDHGGTGLGLAICKRLCQAMSGDIWVESTSKANGTVIRFEIYLPLSIDSEKPAVGDESKTKSSSIGDKMEEKREQRLRRAATGTDPLRVLVVDDNPNNLLITSKLSEHLGYEAKTVRNGPDAIEKLKQDDFDIVLMDVRMAPINGMETTRMIRNGEAGDRSSAAYIIALTAHALQGDREKCLASGMNDYLSKPLTLEKLEESLSRARSALSLD